MHDEQLDRGGRRIAARIGGAEQGPLVVYLHGAPSSRLDADWIEDAARSAGARLAALDRPGYGASDPDDYTFDSHAADVAALADRLHAPRFHVIGQSAGGPYALACAALLPDRVSSVAVTGPSMPFVPGTPWHGQLSREEQEGVRLAEIGDPGASAMLAGPDEGMSRVARELDDDALLDYWLGHMGPADGDLVRRSRSVFLASIRESQRPGQVGWARDNVVRMPTWSFDVTAIRCPVTGWWGVQDAWEASSWLLENVPGVSVHVLRELGHLLLFAKPDLVLADLLSATA